MNLEDVLGIVLTPEGDLYPFGSQSLDESNRPNWRNYHGSSFMKEIVPTAWFQSLNYTFSPMDAKSHFNRLTAMGYGFFLNVSIPSYSKEYYKSYIVQMPYSMTEVQKEVLIQQYDYLSQLVENENASFYGEVYGSPTYFPTTRDVDSFYQSIGIQPKEKITKK